MSLWLGTLGASGLAGEGFEPISTVTVGASGASNIQFNSIPNTYQHLQIRALLVASVANNSFIRLGNNTIDTNNNYAWHHLWGDGSAAKSNSVPDVNYMYCNYNPSTSIASVQITDIIDYTDTSKFKTIRTFAGCDTNGGTSEIAIWSGLWRSTNPITNISITPGVGIFSQHTTASLYGIKS